MKLLKRLSRLSSLIILTLCLSACTSAPQIIAEPTRLAPLPAPPSYPAIRFAADGPRLYLSTPDAQSLYNYLAAITSWAEGVMAERQIYFKDKK
jgi:hypothetical protein